MKKRGTQGFTMTELMVSTVVAAVLMSVLVGLSGNVQKSFGRVKDTMTLQANLRFAMKVLVDDFQRASFMMSPNVVQDNCHNLFPISSAPTGLGPAIAEASGVFTLMGNYSSARDYLYNLNSATIVCRNERVFDRTNHCNVDTSTTAYDAFLEPFNDGPDFDEVFCPGVRVRIQAEEGKYIYPNVLQTNFVDNGTQNIPTYFLNFNNPTLNPTSTLRYQIRGDHKWINPINSVQLQLVNSTLAAPAGTLRASLQKTVQRCRVNQGFGAVTTTLIDHLLPSTGFVVQQYRDTASQGLCHTSRWVPVVELDPVSIDGTNPATPAQIRAVAITLRGRTASEDPEFVNSDPSLAVDVDTGQQGMAIVRTERTVVELRNLGTNIIVND